MAPQPWRVPNRSTATSVRSGGGGLVVVVALVAGVAACARPGPTASVVGGAISERDAAEQGCRDKQMPACAALGKVLLRGSERDVERGLVLLEMSCGANDYTACAALSSAYRRPPRDRRLLERAVMLGRRACEAKVAEGCTAVGEALAARPRSDRRDAQEEFRTACQLGDGRGCELLGDGELEQRFHGDRAAAEEAFARGCALGRASSCHLFAMMSWRDPARREEGAKQLMGSCKRGYGASCFELAVLKAPVISAEPSCKFVAPLAGRSCQLGVQQGCFLLDACVATDSTTGAEGERRRATASQHLLDGCQQRDALACLYWGHALERRSTKISTPEIREAYGYACHATGRFTSVACAREAAFALAEAADGGEAAGPLDVLKTACEKGVPAACCALARQHESGTWVTKDPARARELRRQVCSDASDAVACCPPATVDR